MVPRQVAIQAHPLADTAEPFAELVTFEREAATDRISVSTGEKACRSGPSAMPTNHPSSRCDLTLASGGKHVAIGLVVGEVGACESSRSRHPSLASAG